VKRESNSARLENQIAGRQNTTMSCNFVSKASACPIFTQFLHRNSDMYDWIMHL